MNLNAFKVVPLLREHVEEVTTLWREAMSKAIGIPPVHTFESQAYFLSYILPNNYDVWVVIDTETSKPVAFMANSETEVSQLYVAPAYQRKSIGTHLIERAKSHSKGKLTLRTFEVNEGAQVFYKAHGFIAYSGNSDNEENLPDLEFVWERQD